jgi:hypothetical protein
MRVEPSGVQPQPSRSASGTAVRSSEKTGDTTAPAAAAGGFAPTGELARLIAIASSSPEVRTELVANVAARLAAGEFDTPQAAADTARAMLDPAR